MHAWSRAFGDAGFLLLAITMALGPLARLWPPVSRLLAWRRETGIWTVVLALVHTYIVLDGWVRWDLRQLLGFVPHPDLGRYVMLQQGFGLANVVGFLALAYGLVLGLTSNTFSQKILGGSAWKWLQQGAYVLWALVVVHTAYFLYLHFLSFHRPLPPENWFRVPFVAIVILTVSLQVAAYLATWRRQRLGQRPAHAHRGRGSGQTPAERSATPSRSIHNVFMTRTPRPGTMGGERNLIGREGVRPR
jgi:sulfoxide reductase heme-binding subunit YedZ